MKYFKFNAVFSSKFEEILIDQNDEKEIVLIFYKAIIEIKKYNNLINLLIPSALQSCFLYGNFKILYELIRGPQSNIIFYTGKDACDAKIMINNKIPKYDNCTKLYLKLYKDANFPSFYEDNDLRVYKEKCNLIECKNNCCNQIIDTISPGFEDGRMDKIKDYLVHNNYSNQIFKFKLLDKNSINDLMTILCLYNKIPLTEIELYKNIQYHTGFFNDINGACVEDLKNILFSLFRAIIYPPSRDRMRRSPYSIDIHPNTINCKNGYDLFRIDVVSSRKTGLKCSGKLRILIGKKKKQTTVLAYSDNHDFSNEIINSRTT